MIQKNGATHTNTCVWRNMRGALLSFTLILLLKHGKKMIIQKIIQTIVLTTDFYTTYTRGKWKCFFHSYQVTTLPNRMRSTYKSLTQSFTQMLCFKIVLPWLHGMLSFIYRNSCTKKKMVKWEIRHESVIWNIIALFF